MWSYASLIRCNPRRLKVPLKGMSSQCQTTDLAVYVKIFFFYLRHTVDNRQDGTDRMAEPSSVTLT